MSVHIDWLDFVLSIWFFGDQDFRNLLSAFYFNFYRFSSYHYPKMSVYIFTNPDLPAFYFDPLIYPSMSCFLLSLLFWLQIHYFPAAQYFTLPHTICQIPSDSFGVQMSQIVIWWVRWTLLDSAGVNVDCCPERGVQWSPPDYAVLDSSRVKSPERGIQWTPLDCVHRSPLEWELIPRYKLPYLGGAPHT